MRTSRERRGTTSWMRLGAAALLGAAIWNPQIPGPRAPVALTILLDDSASMARDQVDAAWRALHQPTQALPEGSLLSLIRFAASPQPEMDATGVRDGAVREVLAAAAPPRALPLNEHLTDIGAAIGRGLAKAKQGLPQVLLLISDGVPTTADPKSALQRAQERKILVLWWNPPRAEPPPDAWIGGLDAPRTLRVGETATLNLTMAANRSVEADLALEVDGARLAQRGLSLDPTEVQTFGLDLTLDRVGVHEVTAELRTKSDGVQGNDRRTVLVEAVGRPNVLIVSPEPDASPVTHSLLSGGWPLTAISPGDFVVEAVRNTQVLVLDRLKSTDLPPADWDAIERAVRTDGTGMIVLGGPDTFGSGGYRGSELEGLLPLVSEAPRPQPPASLLFAVDRSGSMGRAARQGTTRFEAARQAIAGAARLLSDSDLTGLIAFDVEARVLMPLASRDDPAVELERAWDVAPSGGTRLAPALEKALALLGDAPTEQRVLVLVTDGRFADAAAIEGLGSRLAEAGIELIALAVGAKALTDALEPLVQNSGGRLLRVRDRAELPRLLQAEVAALRPAVEAAPTRPLLPRPLPFAPDIPSLPELSAYQLTRSKDGATLLASAANGDPLIGAWFAGAGRVVALTAGLGPWTPRWPDSPGWGPFVGGLVQWAGPAQTDRDIAVTARSVGTGIGLTIEAIDRDRDWRVESSIPIRMRDPAHTWRSLTADADGPGRFEALIAAPITGRYDLRIGEEDAETTLAHWHQPVDELLPTQDVRLEELAAEGLVQRWSPSSPAIVTPNSDRPSRSPLAALALALFLLSVVVERAPWRDWRSRIVRILRRG